MCGGAIISDFVPVKRGRKPTTEDLWSELDSLSDFLGLDHRSMNNINNGSKKENLSNLKLAQKQRQPNQVITERVEKPSQATEQEAGKKKVQRTRKNPPPTSEAAPPPAKKRCILGPETAVMASFEQILNSESFHGLEPHQAAAQLSCDGGGSGDYNCDPVDPWMLDDLINKLQAHVHGFDRHIFGNNMALGKAPHQNPLLLNDKKLQFLTRAADLRVEP
uniref:Ethylene-responsive transcription factor RAP2-3-like n=1 Tax=Populus alba TaxID=43335 RepID=A0A4U5Q8F4_POPAL|nr:ethylene-responsive transcription factor RAP2-3-like [Populus alba]